MRIVILIVGTLLYSCTGANIPKIEEEINELSGTQWVLSDPSHLEGTLNFNEDLTTISGNNGCNQYSGAIEIKNYVVDFGEFITSRMYCADKVDEETEFMSLLSKTQRYRLTKKKLILFDFAGDLLEFEPKEQ